MSVSELHMLILLSVAGDGAVGISWSQRYSYCQAQTPTPSQQGSLGYYTTDCVAPLPHLYILAALQVTFVDLKPCVCLHAWISRLGTV